MSDSADTGDGGRSAGTVLRKSRRLAAVAILLAVVAAAGCTSAAAPRPKALSASAARVHTRPNFVFVVTDDLSWNLVSHMPHVLAMERAGMTLSRYYVVDSLCCPSRSAIFTGEYPHDNGVFTNAGSDGGYFAFNQHGDQRKSFAMALHDVGYRTAMMGKYLNQYAPAYPRRARLGRVGCRRERRLRRVRLHAEPERPAGPLRPRGASDYLTDVLAAKAGTFIDSAATSGQPFMLEVATFAPHAPYTPAPRYAHAAQQLTYPKTPAYGRPPAPATVAQGPSVPDGGGRPERSPPASASG